MDVILGLVKKLLILRSDFKVIISSASMDIQLFKEYFNVKPLQIFGRVFPVNMHYRDYVNIKEGSVRKIEKLLNEEILLDSYTMKS